MVIFYLENPLSPIFDMPKKESSSIDNKSKFLAFVLSKFSIFFKDYSDKNSLMFAFEEFYKLNNEMFPPI